MNPHGKFPPRDSSLSPPRPPPKNPRPLLPPVPLSTNVSKPFNFNTTSPVRRKPLPSNAFSPPLPASDVGRGASPESLDQRIEPLSDSLPRGDLDLVVRDLDKQPHGNTPLLEQTKAALAFYSPTGTGPGSPSSTIHAPSIPESRGSDEDVGDVLDDYHSHVDEEDYTQREEEMALKPNSIRPPPLRTDSTSPKKSLKMEDSRKPPTPGGSKIGSFFGWKSKDDISPGADSTSTDISDSGRSPQQSPYGATSQTSAYSARSGLVNGDAHKTITTPPLSDRGSFGPALPVLGKVDDEVFARVSQLESELKEITSELAGSIKREMELEDMVDRLQLEATSGVTADRTSDYFSDSGTSSIRPVGSDAGFKDDMERIKRESEQHRAQLRVDLSQKWQDERNQKKALEAHIQILEDQILQRRRDQTQSLDTAAKAKELEMALDDARRRLAEERQTKENFEDLLTALRVELEQHRSQRDNLRDEVVPQLRSQIDGLEATLSENQKEPYDYARMQQQIQALKDENAALISMRDINSLAEEGDTFSPTRRSFSNKGLGALSRSLSRGGLGRSGSITRSSSTVVRGQPTATDMSFVDHLKAVEVQRDALHTTVKYLLQRQDHQARQYQKRLKVLESERDQASSVSPRKSGYEKEVRSLRAEINDLRKRADDAMEQKYHCEKGLGGLKMDLDRSKQETGSLRQLLQEKDGAVPEALSTSLEHAYGQLQQDQKQASNCRQSNAFASLEEEQRLATQLEQSAERSDVLAFQMKTQLQTNSALRNRLRDAVEHGERNQRALEAQINDLQAKLRKMEDVIASAQTQTETSVMKHEEEIRLLRASHSAQLMRSKNGLKTPTLFTPTARSPLSPMFTNAKRSPRLDQTSTGPGMPLHQALKTEYLEHKVADLEKALSEAEKEMGEVVSRMNTAQMGVAELQSERDEALRQTRRLQSAIMAERETVQSYLGNKRL